MAGPELWGHDLVRAWGERLERGSPLITQTGPMMLALNHQINQQLIAHRIQLHHMRGRLAELGPDVLLLPGCRRDQDKVQRIVHRLRDEAKLFRAEQLSTRFEQWRLGWSLETGLINRFLANTTRL
eukprot:TRINITY_DN13272_c0_g1_i3.p1 TRINITY_DN13272_c0_g1~~TRINITY_DN13272_c0_g1_i3.p1  ORF type:complete len:126 (-),score=16.23 TRINITY_DN13272_c0_g1_i3:534-911(-)